MTGSAKKAVRRIIISKYDQSKSLNEESTYETPRKARVSIPKLVADSRSDIFSLASEESPSSR